MRTRLFRYAGFGFLIGIIAGNLIAWLTRMPDGDIVSRILVEKMGGQAGANALQTFLSGCYGAATVCGMLLYDIDDWSLVKSTVIHYLIVSGLYIPLALILGWTEKWTDLLAVEGCLLIAFMLIWLIMYLRYRAEVKKLNRLIEKKRKMDDRETYPKRFKLPGKERSMI